MATSYLCGKSAFSLCTPAQILRTENGCRSVCCIIPWISNSLQPSVPGLRKAAGVEFGSSAALSVNSTRLRGADLSQRVQKCTRRMRVTASSDDLEEVVFEWRGKGKEVFLTGSFLNWEKQVPLKRVSEGLFRVKQRVAPGTHQYKYVVDGEWLHRDDLSSTRDDKGMLNNEIVVEEGNSKGKEAPKAEKSEAPPAQGSTPTPDELQAIAEKAPPPGKKPEPIQETIAKVTGKADAKESGKDEEKPAKPAAKPAAKAAKKAEESGATDGEEKPKAAAAPKAKAAKAVAAKESDNGAPSADATPTPKAKPAAKGKAAGKAGKKAGKAPAKPLNELMTEDVVPMLATTLEQENVTDVELVWENNELRGCFVNGGVPYCFWAFFPDGKLEGSRGFSLTSHGYPPSTIEPFFVDERAQGMTAEMMVFWIRKRLFAQKSALPKLN